MIKNIKNKFKKLKKSKKLRNILISTIIALGITTPETFAAERNIVNIYNDQVFETVEEAYDFAFQARLKNPELELLETEIIETQETLEYATKLDSKDNIEEKRREEKSGIEKEEISEEFQELFKDEENANEEITQNIKKLYKIKVSNIDKFNQDMDKIDAITNDTIMQVRAEENNIKKVMLIKNWIKENYKGASKDKENVKPFIAWDNSDPNTKPYSKLKMVDFETGDDQNISFVIGDKTSVCDGCADLVTHISNRSGLECETVYGYIQTENNGKEEPTSHAWNLFKFGNDYIIVDVAMDRIMIYDKNRNINSGDNIDYRPFVNEYFQNPNFKKDTIER